MFLIGRWERGRQKYEARSTHQLLFYQKILESHFTGSLQSSSRKSKNRVLQYTWPSFHQFHKSLDYIDFPQDTSIFPPLLQQKTPSVLSSSDKAVLWPVYIQSMIMGEHFGPLEVATSMLWLSRVGIKSHNNPFGFAL